MTVEKEMIERRIALVKSNFKNLAADKTTFADSFYSRLFSSSPQLQPLFEGTPMKAQGAKLHAALVLLVENLRNPDALKQVLGPLGERHKTYGATPQNYPMIGSALLETLEEYSGDDWTDEVKAAWSETFETVTNLMLEGAGMKPVAADVTASNHDKIKATTIVQAEDVEARILLVKSNFKNLKVDKTVFADRFYTRLFERSPQLKPLFEGTPMKAQGRKLHAALVLLVENLRNPDALKEVLGPLGARHKGYGATPQTYPMIGEALLETLEECSDGDWTPEVKDAWAGTFAAVTDLMLNGADGEKAMRPEAAPVPATSKSKPQITAKQRITQQNNKPPNPFVTWFFEASAGKIILVGFIFAVTLIPLGHVFPPIKEFTDFAEPLSIFIALLLFIREMPERKKQFHYQAWGAVDAAKGIQSSHARFIALQDLCDDGVSLRGLDLEGADLSDIEMNGVDLSAANLKNAILKNASLRAANMNHSDFSDAIITGAQLDGTNLSFAKFVGANLSSSDLSSANMIFADLTKANLSGVNLSGSKLNGAKFEGAYLSGTDLTGADVTLEDLAGAFLTGAIMPNGDVYS